MADLPPVPPEPAEPPEPPEPPEPVEPDEPDERAEVVARVSLLDRLGPRGVRRMTPRFGVAVAAAGALVAVGGATGLGGDQLVGDDGDVQRIPGVVLSLVVIIAGYAVLAYARSGALAAAGATASALAIPVLLFFLTFSEGDFPPFSLDAVLLVSTIVWLVAYVAGPSGGRLLFLALALVGGWLFVLDQVEPIDQLGPFPLFAAARSESMSSSELEMRAELRPPATVLDENGMPIPGQDFSLDADGNPIFDDEIRPPRPVFPNEDDFEAPDMRTLGIVSLLFGAGYAIGGFALSRRRYHGAGTPFAAVSIAALVTAVQFLGAEMEQIGVGLLLFGVGLFLATLGAATARRVTTWVGAIGIAAGISTAVQDGVSDSSASAQSAVFLAVGVALVIAGHLAATAFAEPDEELEVRSFESRYPEPVEPEPEPDDSEWSAPL